MSETLLEIRGIEKSFGDNKVLKGINLDLQKGEFFTLLGSSGCGKTTLLRILGGLEQPDAGQNILRGEDITDVPANKRNINTVFQNYALFPYMNVFNNIAYGLKIKKVTKNEIKDRVKEMLELIQLPGFENRMPDQLSGGQKQRIATARALINKPDILLLDEPLGALDLKLRKQMQIKLKELQKKLGITFVYVTHDQEEALNMSDRIGVMNNGVFEQIDTPENIYNKPQSRFVADFIGDTNLLDATVDSGDTDDNYKLRIKDEYIFIKTDKNLKKGDPISFSIRPERIRFSYKENGTDKNIFHLSGKIKNNHFVGAILRTTVHLDNGIDIILNNGQEGGVFPEIGREVWVTWNVEDAVAVIGNKTTDEITGSENGQEDVVWSDFRI